MDARIEVDDAAFLASLDPAIGEWRLQVFEILGHIADEVVVRARELVAKRTERLMETIRRGPLVLAEWGAYVEISAGDGTRYAIFQEFGTYKMAAHPFMRPAFAMAAGLLRAGGYYARTATTSKTRAAARRELHRKRLRRAVGAGLLTGEEARRESRRISNLRRFRG